MPCRGEAGGLVLPQITVDRSLRKGSDPRAGTCRGKLQSKRSKLNVEINKELMLRSGAENLFKATTNKKLKETVALELSFVNSNLQLLKEQLAELNSSVELYQNGARGSDIPMIPLGLKETKEIDFREPFKDFILEHYSETDSASFEDAIAEFMDIRQAMRTPARDASGIALLFEHFNHLYFIERRFFPPDRTLGIYFEWYDSLTGVPTCQRTVAFEKASVLFNIAALYTQVGTRQDRSSQCGLDNAVDSFLRSAGTFQYIHENFTNAPSMDLNPDMLDMLVHLMCAQARECLFEKAELVFAEGKVFKLEDSLILGQEAQHVCEVYNKVHSIISEAPVKDYVPFSWISLVQVKREHYKALAHYFVATGLLEDDDEMSSHALELLQFIHAQDEDEEGALKSTSFFEAKVPSNPREKRYLGKAHLREALLLHEEAMRVYRMCRELRNKDSLQSVLKTTHDRSLNKYAAIDEEDDFQEVLEPPAIAPVTQYQLSLAFPDFSQYKVQDLFSALGPVAIFNAKHHWSAPRTVKLRKREADGFGFSVRGDAPVVVAGVDVPSLAHTGGMKEGDYIVGINDFDVKWSLHDDVVALIKTSGNSLRLRIVTPMNGKEKRSLSLHRGSSSLMSSASMRSHSDDSSADSSVAGANPMDTLVSSASGGSGGSGGGTSRRAWNIFKRPSSATRKNKDLFSGDEHVTFR